MSHTLPFLPGFSFRDSMKTRYACPRTLVYSKGTPFAKTIAPTTELQLLDAQNKVLDREKIIELTYGPKKAAITEVQLCPYLAMDKKVLRFEGYFREETDDWSGEEYRIRPVKVLYYLQNDTMEVIEPKTPNSGLMQGTLFKRQSLPHPRGRGRSYHWKDLNLGTDLKAYGLSIRLTDCDRWTRDYLTDIGMELNVPETIPPDPYKLQKTNIWERHEEVVRGGKDKLQQFLTMDRKVLRFYGTWQDVLSDPPELRKVILQYYLVDDTMELLEDHAPNSGRAPVKVLVRKQKIPVDRNELPESFPSTYLEIKDEDLTWFKPKDFNTGKHVIILGKKVFLYDCDAFTKHYYKTRLGINDMERITVETKPKQQSPRVFPPHVGIGGWDDSLQNCLSLIPKPPRKNFLKEMFFNGVMLRYKARLVTPIAEERFRRFVLTFYPGDDTVIINEDTIPNSGYPAGAFLKRGKLIKCRMPESKPTYYQADDFVIGGEIRASGKTFHLIDADPFVLTFMEEHPEMYTEDQVKIHQKHTSGLQEEYEELLEEEKITTKIREDVIKNFGTSPYPLPECLEPAFDLQHRGKVDEEMYCVNMPISKELVTKVLDICTDHHNQTNMNQVRKILLPALGHVIPGKQLN